MPSRPVWTLIQRAARALEEADEVAVTPIYPAGEAPIQGVFSGRIVEVMRARGYTRAVSLETDRISEWLREVGGPGDVAVFMGAGDLSRSARALLKESRQAAPLL